MSAGMSAGTGFSFGTGSSAGFSFRAVSFASAGTSGAAEGWESDGMSSAFLRGFLCFFAPAAAFASAEVQTKDSSFKDGKLRYELMGRGDLPLTVDKHSTGGVGDVVMDADVPAILVSFPGGSAGRKSCLHVHGFLCV